MRVEGLTTLVRQLTERAERAMRDSDAAVVVGYCQAYAVYVHEDMQARHPVGQAKYLEQPARQLSNDGTLQRLINRGIAAGMPAKQALLVAGLRLQRDSQLLVPVDTSALKNSAFTCLAEDVDKEALAANTRGEAARVAGVP